MSKGLKAWAKAVLTKVRIETQVEALQDCIAECETTAEAQIFRDAIDVLTGKATYVDGQIQRPEGDT